MINATIYGRLGAMPDLRDAGGSQVCEMRIASNHGWKDRKTTTWITVQIWGKRAEWISENIAKGERVIAIGRLYERTWEDRKGEERKTLTLDANHVEKLDWDNSKSEPKAEPARQQRSTIDEEIPF